MTGSTKTMLGVGLAVVALAGCDVVSSLLAKLSSLDLLGIIPSAQFTNANSPDYGLAKVQLGGRDDKGFPIKPPTKDLEIESDDGQDVEIIEEEEKDGYDQGSFLMLVDGSGSTEVAGPWDCDGCPTDAGRIRVEAVKALAEELEACSGDWRMSLFEFGTEAPSAGYSVTTVRSDWTTDADTIQSAADSLSSAMGTPLWDSTWEVLDTLVDDAAGSFGEDGSSKTAGRGIVVISDGEDTESQRSLDGLIGHAAELGVMVHTIGFGPASDSYSSANNNAVDGLRRLADETGGIYGFVTTVDELPKLTQAIAGAMCGGYTELTVKFSEPPASGDRMSGKLKLKGSSLGVPYSFRAP